MNIDLVEKLLEAGALPDAATKPVGKKDGKITALMVAARQGHVPILNTLVGHEASIDLGNAAGVTPLMVACTAQGTGGRRFDQTEGRRQRRRRKRADPLMYAAYSGDIRIVESLLKAEALCNKVTPLRVNALRIAMGGSDQQLIKKLKDAAASEAPVLEEPDP